MKLHEVLELTDSQLDEGLVRNAVAAASFVIAALPSSLLHTPRLDTARISVGKVGQPSDAQQMEYMISQAAGKYRVDPKIIKATVAAAMKYQRKDFPTAKDILSVVGTESAFNPDAVSNLSTDPARGLMQVRPRAWALPDDALGTIDSQIQTGAHILRAYYRMLGSREAALHAYNVGMKNHKTGKVTNPRYVPKVNNELDLYKDM